MPPFLQVPEPHDADILALRERYGEQPSAVLEVLSELKRRHGQLPRTSLQEVARAYRIPETRVAGLASFYAMLSTGGAASQTIRLCDGITCWMHGATALRAHCEQLAQGDNKVSIVRSSCLGLCDRAPAALIGDCQMGPLSGEMGSLPSELQDNQPHLIRLPAERPCETRYVLRRATEHQQSGSGEHPPADYRHLRAMMAAGRDKILALIDAADLRGLGGAGYPTVRKWRQVAADPAPTKYVVCNADESEPLSIKDRILIDTDPHRVLEGVLLAGFATGAGLGIIYIRGEYEPQAQRLERAIREAGEAGWLGASVGGTGFRFEIQVHRGAGAYICGEESALLESLEGKRGEPRPRPPYPVVAGLHQAPTVVNNVETLATAAALCEYGIDDYLSHQSRHARGTKLYSLFGHVKQTGLFEAPRGLTLGELIEDCGGGMADGCEFSFALVGGAAGTFADRSCWELPVDYDHSPQQLPLGTGGILVGDRSLPVPRVLRELLHFFEMESCGKCTPCRVGTSEARGVLDRLLSGAATRHDLDRLESISRTLRLSLCGLGTSVPSPVESALRHFRDQFEALTET